MSTNNYFSKYFSNIKASLDSIEVSILEELANKIIATNKAGNKIIVVGNGGSASIASHLTVDLINAADIKTINFNESSVITCFANDYGYENWVSKALECYSNNGDLAILISSSGQSENMLIAANKAKSMGVKVVTLTGFSLENPLGKLGDYNLWTNSKNYNIVEMTHNIWLLAVVDYIIAIRKSIKNSP